MANPFAGFDPSEYFSTRAMQPHAEVAGGPSGIQALLASIAKRRAEDLAERQFQQQMENQRLDNERADAQQREQFRISNQAQIDTESEHRLAREKSAAEHRDVGRGQVDALLEAGNWPKAHNIAKRYGVPLEQVGRLSEQSPEEAPMPSLDTEPVPGPGMPGRPPLAYREFPTPPDVDFRDTRKSPPLSEPNPPPGTPAIYQKDGVTLPLSELGRGATRAEADVSGQAPAPGISRDPRAQMLATLSQAGVPVPGVGQLSRAFPGAPPVSVEPPSLEASSAARLPPEAPSSDATPEDPHSDAGPPRDLEEEIYNWNMTGLDGQLKAGYAQEENKRRQAANQGQFRLGGELASQDELIDTMSTARARLAAGNRRADEFAANQRAAIQDLRKRGLEPSPSEIEATRRTTRDLRGGDVPAATGEAIKSYTDIEKDLRHEASSTERTRIGAAATAASRAANRDLASQRLEETKSNNVRSEVQAILNNNGFKETQLKNRKFHTMLKMLVDNPNAASDAVVAGAFVKMAQGDSGVISDQDMEVFWYKIGGFFGRSWQKVQDVLDGTIAPERRTMVVEAIKQLARDKQDTLNGIRESLEIFFDGHPTRAPYRDLYLSTYFPAYAEEVKERKKLAASRKVMEAGNDDLAGLPGAMAPPTAGKRAK